MKKNFGKIAGISTIICGVTAVSSILIKKHKKVKASIKEDKDFADEVATSLHSDTFEFRVIDASELDDSCMLNSQAVEANTVLKSEDSKFRICCYTKAGDRI